MFEAMRRGLFDAHHVTGGEIEAVRPWGRDLSPSVTVEFSEGDQTYRVEKTFLSGSSAKLSRLESGSFQPLATGRDADARIREILAADAPGRGLSKHEHWGLAQILWAPQGALHLEAISENVAKNVRAALGVQISGETGGQLEERIARRYLDYFTKTGKPKTGKNAAPVTGLTERRERLKAQLVELRQKQQGFEEASRTVEDARNRRDQARREAESLRQTLGGLRKQAEEYTRLKSDLKNKQESESLAKERYENLNAAKERIEATRKEITELEEKVKQAAKREGEFKTEWETAKELLEKRRSERETARARSSQTSDHLKKIETARQFLSDQSDSESLRTRLDKITNLEAELQKERKKRTETVAPDAKTVREARKLIGERDTAVASLAASQVHLTLTPETTVSVHNLTEDSSHQASPSHPLKLSGDAMVEVKVEGFGGIRAAGPEGGAEKHRDAIREAKDKLEKLCEPYGSTDPDRLDALREKAQELDQSIKAIQQKTETLLDGTTTDALSSRLAEIKARRKATLETYPDWEQNPPVLSELQSAFDQFNNEIRDTVQKAEDAFDKQQGVCTTAENQLNTHMAQLKADRKNLESARKRLEELTQDGLSDEHRTKAISEALMNWKASKETAGQLEEQLKAIPGDPAKDLEKLERQLGAHEDTENKARDDEKTAEGRLQGLAAEGAYSKLIACEEELENVDEQIGHETTKMEAIRLLHDTVTECKQAVVASVAAPLERSATQMLSRVVGPRLGRLRLDQNFVPEAIHPDLASEPVKLDNLSGGEQEQLFLITRLALAEVLAKSGRQLIVLDDVLNATDSGRLARLLTLLEEVSDRLQIIILTCHPERYRGLGGAEFFELNH